jgi:NhaP-type Na+/H+ or K+/H+ antiporter
VIERTEERFARRLPTGTDAWLTGGSLLVLLVIALGPRMVQQSFAGMFRDFGAAQDLPSLTRFALSIWFGPAVALPGALASIRSLFAPRRSWPLAAIIISVTLFFLGLALLLIGLYLPIFAIADKIKAE